MLTDTWTRANHLEETNPWNSWSKLLQSGVVGGLCPGRVRLVTCMSWWNQCQTPSELTISVVPGSHSHALFTQPCIVSSGNCLLSTAHTQVFSVPSNLKSVVTFWCCLCHVTWNLLLLSGVAPPSFVFIQAGTTLNKLTSTSEAWSWTNVGLLAMFAVLAVLPVLFKKQLRAKLD